MSGQLDPTQRLRESLQRAVAKHKAGRLSECRRIYEKILRSVPQQPDALHLLGLVHLSQGESSRAVQLIEKASALRPNEAPIFSNLGNALWKASRIKDAETAYKTALRLNPLFVPAQINLGLLLTEQGDAVEAISLFKAVLARDPRTLEAQKGLADAYRRARREDDAEQLYRSILTDEPAHAPTAMALAELLADRGQSDEALTFHALAIRCQPAEPEYFIAYARTCYRDGDVALAVRLLREAIALAPGQAQTWNELGRALRAQGDLEEARACFEKAISLEPRHADAHRNVVLMGRSKLGDPAKTFNQILSNPHASDADRIVAGFGLGKYLDDCGRFDEAFQAYTAANTRVKACNRAVGQGFDAAAFRKTVEQAQLSRTGAKAEASSSELPVFIVGMPRSGTSLVEQIVASHPRVFGAGELRQVGRISSLLAEDRPRSDSYAATHIDYLQSLAPGASRVVDKMPDNVFHLQTIATLFPAARIIFCVRNPRDVCLSCYFQLFTSGNLFSYDLQDCGYRYRGVDEVMAHGMATTSLRWMTLSYESIIDDLEGQSRRLLDFLDVEWHPACLEFHKTERSVRTASGWQVRQNLFRSSIDRWKHYETHLGTLIEVLDTPRTMTGP